MDHLKETREVVAAVAAVLIRTKNDLADDGKLSWYEMASFAGDLPVLRKAISGVGQVPSELAHLDAEDSTLLSADIADLLVSMGLKHRIADITSELIEGAADIVQRIHKIIALPPTPEVIVE